MDYLDIERIMHLLICLFTILIGIGLGVMCMFYEENIKLAQATNISIENAYVFPDINKFNVSG